MPLEGNNEEPYVPPNIRNTVSFQAWYKGLRDAGHRLKDFQLTEVLSPVPGFVLYWIAKVNIEVSGEGRNKDNEWVISRPDISHCVLVHRDGVKTRVVGIREFRSTVRNPSGFVYEAPGGSSTKPNIHPVQMAIDEVREETGIQLDSGQVRFVASRQLAATINTMHAYVMVAELTDEQFAWAEANEGRFAGNRAESERCALTVRDLTQLFANDELDWSNLGMAASAALTVDAVHKPRYTITTHADTKYVLVVLDALTGSSLDTILGLMAAGTVVIYAGWQRASRGFDQRVDVATTFRLFAEKLTEQGIDARFERLDIDNLETFLRQHAGHVTAVGFVGDYGLSDQANRQLELARECHVPVISAWAGSTPQPELVVVNGALTTPDGGYVPFSRQWGEDKPYLQVCRPTDYAILSAGRLTPAAYYQLAALLITGTHLIYGGAPVTEEAPYGRVHITRTMKAMAGKLGIAGIEARFTCFETTDVEARRLELLALGQAFQAPVLAFVDDQGVAPGVVREVEWAHASGLSVVGMWVGSSGGIEFRIQGNALDVNANSLRTLTLMRSPSIVLV